MLQKILSKKFLAFLLTTIIDILILLGKIPTELKAPVIELFNAIAGVYILAQGIIDMIKAKTYQS